VTVTADINNAVCYALNLNEGSGTSTATLVFNAGSQLTSLYGVTLGNSTSDGPGVIDMTSGGTLSCGGLAVSGAGASQFIPGSGKVILTASSALPSSIVIGFRDLTINAATTLSTSISVSGILTQTAGIVIPTGLTLTLATGSTHIAAAQTVSGAGNYSLSAGALFTTTLATGINGNMTITGTLTLTPGADFTFNGSTAQVTGLMMPVLVRNLTVNNTAGVTLSQATAISSDGSLNLQSGALTTTATNLLSVTNTSSSAITGMSTTNFVKGPLSWSLATTGLTYVFPVGKGSNYYPFTLINPTGTDPVVTCEAFNTSAAGTATAPLSALSTTEYWATSFTGTFTGGTVSLSRAIAIGTMNVIGRCLTAANGSYSSMGGTVSGTTIINSNNTGASLGWFLYATTQSTAITLSNPDSPVTAANVCALSQKVPIHAFKIGTNGNTGSGTLTNFAFTTTGTYLAVHIVNFKIWYSPTNTLGSATLLGTNASPNTAGSQNFPAFTCAIPAGSTYYFWITMDVNANVVNGATIAVSASTSSNMTSTLTRSGSASASGTQTFRAPTVPNAGPDQTVCSSTATLAGNTISAGTGTWSLVSGTAAITTPSSPTSQVTNLGMGDNVLRWTADNLGCTQSDDVKISRWTTPANPGAISGPTQISHSTPGLVYSVSPVMYATSYLWTFPAGWIITAGSGTASVTVTSGNVGQDGSITVQASNLCGNSSSSALAVSITQPHTGCNQCHNTVHNTFGWTLTGTIGNSNLCMSCHNPSGAAQNKPFYNAMKAVPGVSGNSHNWDVPAVNAQYETSLPTNTEILNRLPSGNIVCSTCHNQHNPYSAGYLRIPNTNDDLCKQCHSARVKGLYASNPNNKGSHPVDITYDVNNPSLNSSPSLPLVNGKVSCSTCHDVHYSASNDGNLKRIADENTLCQNCHVSNVSTTMNHQGMSCTTCHYAHSTGSNNIMLVRDVIATPNSGPKAVAFTSNLTASDFATGSGQFSGVCEACHTLTDHYSNTSGGTSDARHNPSPQPCISCHTHKNGFYPQTNCLDCHNTITDKPGVGPVGGRRQIVDNSGDGLGTGGDFKRLSHHVSGSVPNTTDCIKCHYMGDHMKGTVELLDPDAGYNTIITYNPADHTSLDNFCKNCHDANGAGGDMTPFSDNVTVPFVDPSMWNNSGHKNKPLGCVDCHDNGHGSNKHKMLAPYNKIADVSPDPLDDEEEFCLNCHKASGLASTDIQTEFGRTHTHQVNEVPQYGVNSGIECISCHNPHQNNNTYPLSDPDNNKILWTQTVNGTRDFCLRCHDGAPPAGISFPTTFQGTGYNKSKYVNSRHDQVLNNGEQNFVGGGEDCLSCHDRHGTNGTPETNKTGLYTMLKGTFDKSGSATANACNPWVSTGADYGLCFKCHQTSLVSSSSAFGNYHSTHVNDRQTPCIICHDAHGPYDAGEAGLIDFTYGTSALAGTDVNKGSYTLTNMFVKNTSSTGNCYLNCHTTSSGFSGCGTQGHSPENYSGTGLTYPWTYSWPY